MITIKRDPEDPWHARIRDGDGTILGAGVLVGPQRLLTCAHVLGAGQAIPDQDFTVEFLTRRTETTGKVERWVPSRDTYERDVALLLLEQDQPERYSARLRRVPPTAGGQVRAKGFPRHPHKKDGLWVVDMTVAGGGVGPRNEWAQLIGGRPEPPSKGFSGAPVMYRAETEGEEDVVGIVAAGFKDEATEVSYMIPVETIARYLPELDEWTEGATAVDREMARDSDPRVRDVTFAREITDWLAAPNNVRVIITGGWESERFQTLRSVMVSSDREQRPADELLAEAPDGAVPPVGGLDLAVGASGKTVEDVARCVLDRLGIRTGGVDRVRRGVRPMKLVVYGIDDAAEPVPLVDGLLSSLAKQGSCLLLVFHHASSPALDRARVLESDAAADERRRTQGLLDRLIVGTARLATEEREAAKLWTGVAPRVAGVPDPPDRAVALRLARLGHQGPDDGWTVRELLDLLRIADHASAYVHDYRRILREALAKRRELRGRLEAIKAKAGGRGLAENIELGELYDRARRLLWEQRPCDLTEAEAAVRRYGDAVRRERADGGGEDGHEVP
ncbi:serine protease [Actinoallomurus acanthiterrae]